MRCHENVKHIQQRLTSTSEEKSPEGPGEETKENGNWQLYSTLVRSIRLSVNSQTSLYRLEENKGCTVVPLKTRHMCTVAIHQITKYGTLPPKKSDCVYIVQHTKLKSSLN